MSTAFFLVPEFDSDGNETGYYTREPDGTSGMTVSALAEFVGSSQPGVISSLLKRIRESDPYRTAYQNRSNLLLAKI